MIQDLFYTSSSILLNKQDDKNISYILNNISSLTADSSSYQLHAYSSSNKIASFPINNTNVFYTEVSSSLSVINNIYPKFSTNIMWYYNIEGGYTNSILSQSNCSIFDNTDETYLLQHTGSNDNGSLNIAVGDNIIFNLNSSGSSYDSYITLYDMSTNDATSSILFNISSSLAPVSYSLFIPSSSIQYMVSFSIVHVS